MDTATLLYFEDVLNQDVSSLCMASTPVQEVPEGELKRALNVKLDAIRADVVNIQHLLDS